MRPFRLFLLLTFFVALPIFLTCLSLLAGSTVPAQPPGARFQQRPSRLRALLSFSTPSSLFPPSAIISLTDDNSTFFLARPAAFGPSLAANGLSGQLWVGKGFGDQTHLHGGEVVTSGFELGCSDVPGWDSEHKRKPENGALDTKKSKTNPSTQTSKSQIPANPGLAERDGQFTEAPTDPIPSDDGTDDHLHAPLPDSHPASPSKPGQPARAAVQDKSRSPVHADIESLQESADIAGKVVLLSRGGCGFLEKVKWAQRRGGIALIVGDNEPGGPLTIMYAKGDASNVTIPSLFTSYNAAHLLASLTPPPESEEPKDGSKSTSNSVRAGKQGIKSVAAADQGPVFTTTIQARKSKQTAAVGRSRQGHGFLQHVLSAVGLDDGAQHRRGDSRRPPSSGNIDWVLLEDWDEENPSTKSTSSKSTSGIPTKTNTKSPATSAKGKAKVTSAKHAEHDDFVIGVQDWRDTDVIAPKPTTVTGTQKANGKAAQKTIQLPQTTATLEAMLSNGLKGGSITPGSGEYDHRKGQDKKSSKDVRSSSAEDEEILETERTHLHDKIASFFLGDDEEEAEEESHEASQKSASTSQEVNSRRGSPRENLPKHEGLWVTLTPTYVSASPFFDTLLVLVVSPLVTLSVVYGLLLLRSRFRRRRWRAPKSVVEQLPVRTYHTMSSTSSTTSSQLASPVSSRESSPQLRPTSNRQRPRSQTTDGVVSPPPAEKKPSSPPKRQPRYTGRQVECVVCLEEYVDGESKVMSLPCGHEFHAECITPWLVNRRRTCPICKGDVVRSLTRASAADSASSSDDDSRRDHEQTSDDVQERVVNTVNHDGAASVPIPIPEGDAEDIERGDTVDAPLLGGQRRTQHTSGWRGFLGAGTSRLSGDTLWGSTPNDRTR